LFDRPKPTVGCSANGRRRGEFYFYRLVTNDIMKSYNISSMTPRLIGML